MSPNHHRSRKRADTCGVMLLMVSLLCGCRAAAPIEVPGAYQPLPPGGINFGMYNQTPRPRLGCLPYPGLFTLFEVGDPKRLGHHSYNGEIGGSETDRGIIYTCRGGFIDIAHVRKTADLCKYVAVRVEMALMNDWTALQLKSLEPSVFVLYLDYPPFWKSLSPDEKKQLAHELSIRIGQRVAMAIMNWHELLTWFGYQSTPLISERPSAFTWDDTGAHFFGVMVAGRAMRDPRDWDDAMTRAIDNALAELGAVTADETMTAIDQIEGQWWSGSQPLKRWIELGWDGKPAEAWLVRDLPFCKGAVPYHYTLPVLDDVMGRDFSGLLRIDIHPHVMQTDSIRNVIPGNPTVIDVDKHLPAVMNHMRQWQVRHEGEKSLRPN